MKTSDFYYNLPEELIAQTAADPRDSSRLLVYNRATKLIEHRVFKDIGEFLRAGDVLVINNTKVIKARLFGIIEGRTVKTELLLLKRLNLTDWEAISRPARKIKIGTVIIINDELKAEITGIGDSGIRTVRFIFEGVFEDILSRSGHVPLPPYITTELKDESRYQTIYSKVDGSSAAPTAGLHFTKELMDKLKDKGVIFSEILLHIGLSTFRPVKAENIEDHKMHNEYYEISSEAAETINNARREGRRVICVGTTAVRTLESASDERGIVNAGSGNTEIFIYPGYKFKAVDCLITNFHLPESTLIMLVSAFAGQSETINIYNTAVKERYRFFSFGDSMIII
jgi:S-adenosylmethionine:tRNA ribosyltransferase-isomerase